MTLKISISGVRGYVPDSLTPEVVLNFAKAFGTYLYFQKPKKKLRKVVIGSDPRQSSEQIKNIVCKGLFSTGCDVIDLGICPTPTVGIMTKKLMADGGVIITASHNPLPWNGIKFVRDDGIFLNETQAKELIEIYEKKNFHLKPGGSVKLSNAGLKYHINKVIQTIKPPKTKLKVAIDCVNGAGSVYAVELLKKLGCKVVPIHCNTRLPFPHDPEPIAKNLSDLMQAVKANKADIGFALDSDADRLAIISEQGIAIGEELTLALAVKAILSQHKKKNALVVCNLSTTAAINDIASQYFAKCLRTKIGEVHVAETLKRMKGLIGGEGNGGVIYPKIGFNRDSLAGIALIISYMTLRKLALSKLVAQIPTYYSIKSKIECHSKADSDALIEKIKNRFNPINLDLTEGVKVIFENSWVHVRPSNTEPIVRFIAEARSLEEAQKLIDQVSA